MLLAANIDDMTPEALAYALERLFAVGALDAWFTPITMKKSRPAVQIAAICREADRLAITAILLKETTTFGVRALPIAREKTNRRWETVTTQWGPVRVKIKEWEGAVLDAVPEYEQVAALARAAEVPFREVYAAAAEAGRQFVGSPSGGGVSMSHQSLTLTGDLDDTLTLSQPLPIVAEWRDEYVTITAPTSACGRWANPPRMPWRTCAPPSPNATATSTGAAPGAPAARKMNTTPSVNTSPPAQAGSEAGQDAKKRGEDFHFFAMSLSASFAWRFCIP